ncbi:aldehyde dehydrogenase family protein [Paracoccus sp. PS-1]|uniref:aldehyde dehydrogenase family protein n=1 Tax=unclassified Paracoccus (in: a-proteobacteria) TaxID=2688777 RepID=UPI0004AE4E3B|nr:MULTISPECIES: aldehyde dehydrogenase family protein [unclassified Paracoccus (in: a-proteobacteria)]MDQ7261865.1 aldehyde dehydrogenase family protein [Paracoccus sp. PS1]
MKDRNEIQGNLIGGEWLPDGDCRPDVNPSDTRDIIGFFASADRAAVDQAVHAARSAFPAWAAAGPQVRHDLLDAVGTELLARKEEIGHLLAREEGKTLPEAMGETVRAGQVFKFFAGEALRVAGDAQQSVRPGIDVAVTREPLGVIALITPWNFPIAIPAWKIAPALAYGNCVVLKPAELTPGCAHVIAQLLHKHGCPAGVFNLVMGQGSVLGDALVSHPGIDAVSFTGSVATGSRIAATCGTLRRKVQLEMGGKNPMVVMDDADLQTAVQACLNGAFFSTGQRCTASSRLIVQKGIHDAFVERLGREMRALRVGDALQPDTQIGPVVDQRQLDSNLAYVDLARSEAAEVLGGERLELDKPGFYQAPALFLNTTNGARINREEIFGPCASVIKVEDFDEALAAANDTEFGLSAGICTGSLKHASEFRRRVEAGMVMVNLPTAGVDYHVPFGGRKGSSFGPREQGRYAAEFYTVVKTAYQLA